MRGDDAGRATGQLHVTAAESAAARAVVTSIQQRFRVADRAGVPAGAPRGLAPAGGHQLRPAPVLGEAEAESFRSEGARLRPRIGEAALARVVRPAQVSLPERASGAFTVADESTSMSMRVSLVGALDAPAEVAGGFVVYRGGGPDGTHLVHRATAVGTEDFVVLEQAPAEPSVRYEVALSEQVAGLRLVAGCVQLLDAGGAPRLRMAPPYLVDAAGTRHEASVALEGCAFDATPPRPGAAR
ncbi:MAG: hypothetical protein IPI67_01445 [Myxococcales bacterium]|nr:hypothetical protein [Myxococcales bacterium]